MKEWRVALAGILFAGCSSSAVKQPEGSIELQIPSGKSQSVCELVRPDEVVCVGRLASGELYASTEFVNTNGDWQPGGGGVLRKGQTKVFSGHEKGISIVVDSNGKTANVVVDDEFLDRAPQLPRGPAPTPNVPRPRPFNPNEGTA